MLIDTGAVHTLAAFLKPWQSLYSNSKTVSTTVTFLHIAGVLFAGGFAIASDRATFRALRGTPETRSTLLTELRDVHRPVLVWLGVLFVSGLLQATSDVETFATSVVFWIHMALVALLLVNGAVLERAESSLRGARGARGALDTRARELLWGRLRASAIASMALWTATVLAGTILMSS